MKTETIQTIDIYELEQVTGGAQIYPRNTTEGKIQALGTPAGMGGPTQATIDIINRSRARYGLAPYVPGT
jgi:hypothetical protein